MNSTPKVSKHFLKWKSWYGDENLALNFPENWEVENVDINNLSALSDAAIKNAILSPLGNTKIRELTRKGRKVAIAIDDLTRPTQTYRIIPFLLEELKKCGIRNKDIHIIAALGAHRPMLRQDFAKKIGTELTSSLVLRNHSPFENLSNLGLSRKGTPIFINKDFLEADVKIAVGGIIPHGNAGFGGGGKIIIPGLGGIQTLEKNHKSTAVKKQMQGEFYLGRVENNENREEIQEIYQKVGLDFLINVLINSDREIVKIFAGNPQQVFYSGCKEARNIYSVQVPSSVDVGIFNAYPKDTEFLQSVNALNICVASRREIVREGGVLVLVTASIEGRGVHFLHDKGMRLFVPPKENKVYQKILNKVKFFILSPNVSYNDVVDIYSQRARLFRNWDELLSELNEMFPDGARVGLFKCAAIQYPESINSRDYV